MLLRLYNSAGERERRCFSAPLLTVVSSSSTREGKTPAGGNITGDSPTAAPPSRTVLEMGLEDSHARAHHRFLLGAGLAGGIFTCLLSYGYFQEKIMTGQWGDEKLVGKHISSVFLVMCNRITSMSIGAIFIMVKGETMRPGAPIGSYCAIAFSNMLATTCQYEALRYVSFPTQTLAKTAKMIPVMVWGTLLSRKLYKVVHVVH